jgi:hypothetical protein
MRVYEIYIAFVIWGIEEKRRPVLILEESINNVTVFRITTHSESVLDKTRVKHFIINDWQHAGLDVPSYIDTRSTVTLPNTAVDSENLIGKLSIAGNAH